MPDVQVVGGGLTGLACAIECAERGASVVLRELAPRLGGRARHLARDGFVTNLGPHALYMNGPGARWLERRGLRPEVLPADLAAARYRTGGRISERPAGLAEAYRALLSEPAPHDESFAVWARSRVPADHAALVEGVLTLPTNDGAPGRHAAATVQAVLARTVEPGVVTYVRGGWGVLVDALARRARELGVDTRLGARVEALEDGDATTILAIGARAAARLLGDPGLVPDGQSIALRDLGLRPPSRAGRGPVTLLDLDEGVYLARYSAYDRSLAPPDHDLLQCCAGLRPGEDAASAHARIEEALDAGYGGWRERVLMDRRGQTASPGHRDPVGRTWRDRPTLEREDGTLIAGDWVAAPGLLSEVCFTSAAMAAERAVGRVADGRRRSPAGR